MNTNRKVSAIENKLIIDYFTAKNVNFSEIAEVFHKDNEVVVRYADTKGTEKFKTFKATELIAFAYDKGKSVSSGEVLQEVQKLVGATLKTIEEKVMLEITNLKKETNNKIDASINDFKNQAKGKEDDKTASISAV